MSILIAILWIDWTTPNTLYVGERRSNMPWWLKWTKIHKLIVAGKQI